MKLSDQPVVRRASKAFMVGDYNTALRLYQQAAQRCGRAHFELNIKLCERFRKAASQEGNSHHTLAQLNTLELQLYETQQLLEYYYNRTQVLEQQLLER